MVYLSIIYHFSESKVNKYERTYISTEKVFVLYVFVWYLFRCELQLLNSER